MAVHSILNKSDIKHILEKYNIGNLIKFEGIKEGIENTNYLIITDVNKYILTIFEKRVSKKEVPFFMKLMDQLNSSKINCPKPLKNKTWPNGYSSDHLTNKSIMENAQTDKNMYKKPN